MAFCSRCQGEVSEEVVFCPRCGTPLGEGGQRQTEGVYPYQTHPIACVLAILFSIVWLCMASAASRYNMPGQANFVFYFIALGLPILAMWSGFKELGLYPSSVRELGIAGNRLIFRRRSGRENPIIEKVTSVRERGRGAGRRLETGGGEP